MSLNFVRKVPLTFFLSGPESRKVTTHSMSATSTPCWIQTSVSLTVVCSPPYTLPAMYLLMRFLLNRFFYAVLSYSANACDMFIEVSHTLECLFTMHPLSRSFVWAHCKASIFNSHVILGADKCDKLRVFGCSMLLCTASIPWANFFYALTPWGVTTGDTREML